MPGGEPLLVKAHYDFLKKCVKMDISKNLILEYNSNITSIPKTAWDIWKYFKQVIIGVSLDGVGKINSFIRYPSKWDQIEKNLYRLDKTEENFLIHIAMTVSVLNIWHLSEFIQYIMKSNYKKIPPWSDKSLMTPHPVHRPPYLNVNILEEQFKKKIKEHFENCKEKILSFDWQGTYGESNGTGWRSKIDRSFEILDSYMEFMYTTQYKKEELMKHRINFIRYMDKLDELRGTCWKKVFPELYESTLAWRKYVRV